MFIMNTATTEPQHIENGPNILGIWKTLLLERKFGLSWRMDYSAGGINYWLGIRHTRVNSGLSLDLHHHFTNNVGRGRKWKVIWRRITRPIRNTDYNWNISLKFLFRLTAMFCFEVNRWCKPRNIYFHYIFFKKM